MHDALDKDLVALKLQGFSFLKYNAQKTLRNKRARKPKPEPKPEPVPGPSEPKPGPESSPQQPIPEPTPEDPVAEPTPPPIPVPVPTLSTTRRPPEHALLYHNGFYHHVAKVADAYVYLDSVENEPVPWRGLKRAKPAKDATVHWFRNGRWNQGVVDQILDEKVVVDGHPIDMRDVFL